MSLRWMGVLSVLALLGLEGCAGDSTEPQTGNVTLCRDKVAEMSIEANRYQLKGAESCQGCQELQDTLRNYDCISLRVTAGGTFHRGGSFSQVGVYEGTLDLNWLKILEWRAKRKQF